MTSTNRTTMRQAREKQEQQTHQEEPAPSVEEIRRQLGWDLIPANRQPCRSEQDLSASRASARRRVHQHGRLPEMSACRSGLRVTQID